MLSYGRSSLPFAFLARPTPQATGTPRPDQWLLMGVQACRWPAFKRLKRLKSFLARPTPQAKATRYPKATSMASYGRSSLPFASL